MLVAGIDGGQSSTVAAIADENGRVIARGGAGPADEIGADARSTRLHDALRDAVRDALRNAGLAADTQFDAIVAGISGYEGTVFGVAPELPARRLRLMHDAPIAYAAALGEKAGVTVIAGTGSVAFARASDGRELLCGGWGFLFGDEGSAFWIARSAITRAIEHETCAGVERLLSFFDVHSLRELVRGFYVGKVARDELASFAPLCIEAAKTGRQCTCLEEPAKDAARMLARLAAGAAIEPAEQVAVAFTGGLMRDEWFRDRVAAELPASMKSAGIARWEHIEPAREPVLGAVLLALREAGAGEVALQ